MIINGKSPPITVLAAGKGWLAVDKPVGVTVHNAPGRDVCSLTAAYIQKEPAVSAQIEMAPDFGVNPVHRLDRETSGVVILAATSEVFRFFSKQFESRQVKKRYIALLHGRLQNPQGTDPWGMWRWTLAKTAGGRLNPGGTGLRQPCETRFRVLDCSTHYSMVEIELGTGRKHQIRRHAKLSGHPVVGDARYGSQRAANYLKRNLGFDRLALHACALRLMLPGGIEPETIQTPSIPARMQELFENDRSSKVGQDLAAGQDKDLKGNK